MAVEALGLAPHELPPNSLKDVAPGDPLGGVEITCDVSAASSASGRQSHREWIEHTVAFVFPPIHKGFGWMVIEQFVEATFRGRVMLTFPPEGPRWHLDAPATLVAGVRRNRG
jgi:two-component sensor histidine kinase